MSAFEAFNRAMQTHRKAQMDRLNIGLAREKNNRDKETFESNQKIAKEQIKNLRLKNRITQNEADFQEQILKDQKKYFNTEYDYKNNLISTTEDKNKQDLTNSEKIVRNYANFMSSQGITEFGGVKFKSKKESVPEDKIEDFTFKIMNTFTAEDALLPYEEKYNKAKGIAERILAGETKTSEDKFKVGETKSFGAKGKFKYIGNNQWEKAE